MTMAVVAWSRVSIRPGSQETSQPRPVAMAVCGVAGLVMLVSVIVMPDIAYTALLDLGAGMARRGGLGHRPHGRQAAAVLQGSAGHLGDAAAAGGQPGRVG